ncbi:hypothetical protein Tco_0993620 [Tanacetum coccineum]
MPSCVLCVDGSCPSDCPALDLFPSEEPHKEQSTALAETVMMAVGFKTEFIKDCLRAAKVSGGGLLFQKEFILKLILGHEAMHGVEYFAEQKKILAEIKETNAKSKELKEAFKAQFDIHEKLVEDIVDAAVQSSTTGLKSLEGLRKCTTVMDDGETSRGD